ncbi:hypothetical protein EZS27_034743 [termite gut metagenome]|uniref:Uncharacterized protein n=1 Tax=termite gut metagenome TaxID=433724 RepID=A0A5J4PYK0_9ZZZZ
MKRVVSIFLFLVILIIGLQPTLTIHFCGGELYSVDLMTGESVGLCCGKNTDDTSNHNHAKPLLTKPHTSCCHIQKIQISTDNYLRQARLNTTPVLPVYNNAWIVLNYMANRIESDNSFTIQHLFPPGGLNKQSIDVLAYMCIYRI